MGTVFFEVKVEHVEHSLAALKQTEIHFFLTIPTTAQKRAVESIKAMTKHMYIQIYLSLDLKHETSVQKGRQIKMSSFDESFSGILN